MAKHSSKDAKRELESLAYCRRNAQRQTNRIERLKAKVEPRATTHDKVIVSGGQSQYEDRLIDLAEAMFQAEEVISSCDSLERMIEHKVNLISDHLLAEIIIARYIEELEWKEVAEIVNYSLSWVHKLNRRALRAYAEIM